MKFMLIESETYKRNQKNKIQMRQIVTLQCDDCQLQWQTKFVNLGACTNHYCKNCRSKRQYQKIVKKTKILAECLFCKKSMELPPSKACIKFCSNICSQRHKFQTKYGHLTKSFADNSDAVAYLCGLILGDGHLRKRQAWTTEITISFDSRQKSLIDLARNVFRILKIDTFKEMLREEQNCLHIGFCLPVDLLEHYGMNFSGKKIDCQPEPTEQIIKNVCFAVGLINSDGWVGTNRHGKPRIAITGTVKSIVDCLKKCLSINGINFTEGKESRTDSRSGRLRKTSYNVYISRAGSVERLVNISPIVLK